MHDPRHDTTHDPLHEEQQSSEQVFDGKLLHVEPVYDPQIEEVIKPFFDDYYSIQFENYAVGDEYLHEHEVVPTAYRK